MTDKRYVSYVRECIVLGAAVVLGWMAHGNSRTVAAATAPNDLMYQFVDLGQGKALTMYDPADHELYVYQSALGANSHVNCSFHFHVGRPGAPLERQNCPIGSFLP